MKFYASKKHNVVCKETCIRVKNSRLENLVSYDNLNDAINDGGFYPCSHCLPPSKYITVRDGMKTGFLIIDDSAEMELAE